MQHLLQSIINALLSADADAVVGAEYGRPSTDRVAQRNGYRHRPLDKRVKTLGIDSLSRSQVSLMAADLDQLVEEFRHRPLDGAGPFTFVPPTR
jgi:putative transposase